MEAEAEAEFTEVTCPICRRTFYPQPFKVAAPPAPEQTEADRARIAAERAAAKRGSETRELAEKWSLWSIILLIIGIVLIGFAVTQGIADERGAIMMAMAGGGLVCCAFWAFMIAQIIHIRANTEK